MRVRTISDLHVQKPSPIAAPVLTDGAARMRLREATASDHAAVDDVYSGFDLSSLAGYAAFLQAQHACLAPLEGRITATGVTDLLPDWPDRQRAALLADDLADLGRPSAPPLTVTLDLPSPAAVLGAVYVLEGSRFGGMLLARQLPPGAPARFLGAAAQPQLWRGLVAALDRHLDGEAALAAATAAARSVFDAFAAAGRDRLDVARG
jgi:heme oxygenase